MTNYALTRTPVKSSKSVPKNGQVQLREHVRAAFASQTIGSVNYPFAMLFHIELAEALHSPR
jgi:hypothetical protein